MSDRKAIFEGSPQVLAVLVNESRARRPDLSLDAYARAWIPAELQRPVTRLWNEYATRVYPMDDLVLAVRNRFFLNLISKRIDASSSCILMPCGLTSYPFLLKPQGTFFELDLPELIGYKRSRYEMLRANEAIPSRKIVWWPIDVSEPEQIAAFLRNSSTPTGKKTVVIEGLSYYMDRPAWASLISEITASLNQGDVLSFDFWSTADSSDPVYKRFLEFCKEHGEFAAPSFNFIEEQWISDVFAGFHIEIHSVVDAEQDILNTSELRGKSILKDTYAVISKA